MGVTYIITFTFSCCSQCHSLNICVYKPFLLMWPESDDPPVLTAFSQWLACVWCVGVWTYVRVCLWYTLTFVFWALINVQSAIILIRTITSAIILIRTITSAIIIIRTITSAYTYVWTCTSMTVLCAVTLYVKHIVWLCVCRNKVQLNLTLIL